MISYFGISQNGLDNGRVDRVAKSTHTARYKKLRDLLVAARRDAGLTQAEVASALNKPQSYVSKVESGERRIDPVELLDFLSVMGADEVRFIRSLAARGR